jgi:hypothetical protein
MLKLNVVFWNRKKDFRLNLFICVKNKEKWDIDSVVMKLINLINLFQINFKCFHCKLLID